jgi:hypothetical protein
MWLAPAMLHLNGCQPRTLASLQDLQECSYRRLLRLAPDLRRAEGACVSRVKGALDLHLVVTERSPYTTTLNLTYRFPAGATEVLEPDLTARVYHDARLVEVVSLSRRHPPHAAGCWRRPEPSELEAKWEVHRFLQRWLGYCLHQGHLFLPVSVTAGVATALVD